MHKLKAFAAAAIATGGLALIASPALAEHSPTRATAQAITRVVNHGVRVKVIWIHVSSRGPYALVHLTSHAAGPAYFLMKQTRGRWRTLSVISDEGLRCNQVPRAVINDLDLLRYADAGKCSGPYSHSAAHATMTARSSPAAVVRAWDSAYSSSHWLSACHDLTERLAEQLGRGLIAANAYDRCADAFIAGIREVPRAAKAIQATVATGKILHTTRSGQTAHVAVLYTVRPPVLPSKLHPRQTYTLVHRHAGWLISTGGAL